MGPFFFFVIHIFYSFTTLPLDSSHVCQSNPPEHVVSTSGQSDDFQPGASFSLTVGRKQPDTWELKRGEDPEDSWRVMDQKKKYIKHTLKEFLCGEQKHSLSCWDIIATKEKKEQWEQYVQIQSGPLKGLFLMIRLCPFPRADPKSAGLILKWQSLPSSLAITSWSRSSYGEEWGCYIPTFLYSDRL